MSSIIVTQATGDRAVVSMNAVKTQADKTRIPDGCLHQVDIVLIDGHQIEVSAAIAQQAKSKGIPVVVDGGSWKPGLETVLPFADYAICSANFHPPNCQSTEDVVQYLRSLGVPQIAITHGEHPIEYWSHTETGVVHPTAVKAVDTLGAGDIFHGAFCHYILQASFPTALEQAAKIAAYSCQFFGTRQWLSQSIPSESNQGKPYNEKNFRGP